MPKADASNTTTHTLPPQLAAQDRRRREALETVRDLRKQARAEIDRLIDFLDSSDLDPDLEEPGDDEPALGWTELGARFGAYAGQEGDGEDGGDDEPSLGWSSGGHLPELQRQEGREFHMNADGGQDMEDEHDGCEPDGDNEPSLGWTHTTDQTAPAWHANNLGMTDMEEGVGPVRKKRAASKTGGNVHRGCVVLI